MATTAFAQTADSTVKKTNVQSQTITVYSNENKQEVTSIKRQQKVLKPTTTWSKIKDLFE